MTISDIRTLTNLLVGTDSNELDDSTFLILVNSYYERLFAKILAETSGSRWKMGDFNRTAFPTFSITMIDGQQTYDWRDWLDTTNQQTLSDTTPLVILGAEVLDIDGNPVVLERISLEEIHDQKIGFDNYQKTDGLPNEYELRDNLIVLYPAPSSSYVTLNNGLIVYFLPGGQVFTSSELTTGTKEPGIPRPFHEIVAYGAATTWALSKGLANASFLKEELREREKELMNFLSNRDKADRPMMSMKKINHI